MQKEPKMRFLAIILSFVSWIDLILHIIIELCFPPFGNTTKSLRIIQKSQKSIFEWSKVSKMMFLAIILSLVCWIDLILHMMIELYVFHHLATLPGHEGSFNSLKKDFSFCRSTIVNTCLFFDFYFFQIDF